MSDSVERPRHLFIVHLWREPGRILEEDQWRGSVEHAATGQRRYFGSLSTLIHFLQLHLEQASASDELESAPTQPDSDSASWPDI